MNLADNVKRGDDNFRLLLNYRDKYTFTQEPCVYGGKEMSAYDVMYGHADFFIIADLSARRGAVFDAFDKFIDNMLKYTTKEDNPYSAVLEFDGEKMVPALTIDSTTDYGLQAVLLIFGLRGGDTVLGYDRADLRETVRRSFSAGVDLRKVREGGEDAARELFGDYHISIAPSREEEADGMGDTCAAGSAASDGVAEKPEEVSEGDGQPS